MLPARALAATRTGSVIGLPGLPGGAIPTPATATSAGSATAAPATTASTQPKPTATAPSAAAPSSGTQVAALPTLPKPTTPAVTPTAPATSAQVAPAQGASALPYPLGAAGGYMVQISSQKNENDARATFKDLQVHYPKILGAYSVDIQRADLGDKGVFFRARVGPFAQADAQRLCDDLKSAGGDCLLTH